MYCKNCGSQIDDNAVVCPHCGAATDNFNNSNNVGKETKDNYMAIIGFILSFFIAIAGLICSIIGYKNAGGYENRYKGLALAGIIISIAELALTVIVIIIYVLIFASLIAVGGVYM